MDRHDVTGLKYFDEEDLLHIEIKSKGLTLEECFDFLGVDEKDVPENELYIAKRIHRKGRAAGISNACDSLFTSMNARNGGSVAMDYLNQLSDTFSVSATPSGSASGFNFQVNLQ